MYNLQKQLEEFISHTEETNRQDQGPVQIPWYKLSRTVNRNCPGNPYVGLFYTLSADKTGEKERYE